MSKRKTTAEFIEELNKINPNIEVLGEYMTAKTKILCKCKVCENEWEVRPDDLLKGRGCPICGVNKSAKARRKSKDDFVRELREINPNIEVLGEYVSSNVKILCKCKVCKNEWESVPYSLLIGHDCPECGAKKIGKTKRMSKDDFVRELHEINPNIEPLENYTVSKNKILFACKVCGTHWKTTPDNVLRSHGCPSCAGNMRMSYSKFITRLYEIDNTIKVLTSETEYKNTHTHVDCECLTCGTRWKVTPHNLFKNRSCPNCARLSRMDLTLSEEERVANRQYPEYTQFINDVLKRDDFTCQLTLNSGNVVVHHLDGYHWCVEKRTDINNAITLSEDMHKEFHNRYGRGNNTKQQFVEFVNDLYKENKITRSAYEWVMSERLK